jgi:acyl-CoA thioesterase I
VLRFLWIPLFASFLFSGCDRGKNFASVRNLDSPGENVVCFGDSLTEGVGAGRGEDYPSILARQLVYPVINAGRAGDTSAESLSRLDRDVLSQNPRLVVVLLGGNDFLRQLPLSDTKKNVQEIVRRVQESGAMVVLVGMRLGLFTDEYGPAYEEIAKKNGALFIPEILKGILSDPKLRSDSFHPNAAGYQLMAQRILERIRPLLGEADRKRLKGQRIAGLQGQI